tara:strand:- start:518 stop:1363 length:846 start_codon:yes stop_codon:yes gene_type:complete
MPKAVIENTEVYQLKSKEVGDVFEITVMKPEDVSDQPLPVIYLTDANNSLGTGCDVANLLMLGGEIPQVILVAIGYPLGGDFNNFIKLRTRDFSPSLCKWQTPMQAELADMKQEDIICGGAPNFLEFLTTELRDFIGSKYNTLDDTTYIGDSMGGLFGVYTLFHKPHSFKRYVIGSPWMCWDYPLCFEYEKKYSENHDDLKAIVYMATGGDEHILYPNLPDAIVPLFKDAKTEEYSREMFKLLESRNYPSLNFRGKILDDETHFTMVSSLIGKGLKSVFNQ